MTRDFIRPLHKTVSLPFLEVAEFHDWMTLLMSTISGETAQYFYQEIIDDCQSNLTGDKSNQATEPTP